MKKVLFTLLAVFALSFAASAQNNAIGLRFAGGSGYAAEISYLQGLGSNRIELDLGLTNSFDNNYHYANLTGVYQWCFNITGGLGWFVGAGANLGVHFAKNENPAFGLGVDGQIGLEYKFSFPLQLSFDVRPQYDLIGSASGFGWGGALGVRYMF